VSRKGYTKAGLPESLGYCCEQWLVGSQTIRILNLLKHKNLF